MINNNSKQSMLVLSTAHISYETSLKLNNDNLSIMVYQKLTYGWFIPVTNEKDEIKQLPTDIREVMEYAENSGCDWVMFDCDADKIPALPEYDW